MIIKFSQAEGSLAPAAGRQHDIKSRDNHKIIKVFPNCARVHWPLSSCTRYFISNIRNFTLQDCQMEPSRRLLARGRPKIPHMHKCRVDEDIGNFSVQGSQSELSRGFTSPCGRKASTPGADSHLPLCNYTPHQLHINSTSTPQTTLKDQISYDHFQPLSSRNGLITLLSRS